MSDIHLKIRPIRGLLRHVLRGTLAAGGLAATVLSSEGHARADAEAFGDFGVYAGYTWGEGGGFTWGIEGRAGAVFGDEYDFSCTNGSLLASAATARLSFIDLDRVRIGGSAQAGVQYGPTAAMFDVGLGYRFGEHGGVSLPIGLNMQVWGFDTFVNVDALLGDGLVGGGFRLPPIERPLGCVVEGRALHGELGRSALPALRALSPVRLRSELDAAVVAEWAERARAEWASVPAFLQLADQLRRARAPRALVERALRAANDEVRHAMMTAGVVSQVAQAPMAFDRVTPATRAPAVGRDALVRLAVESWTDGCLGEGFAAAKAAREAETAAGDGIRAIQRTIAAEEASHAALAWDVLAWSIREGGDDVRDALWATRDATSGEASSTAGVELTAYGIASDAESERIAETNECAARSRLSVALAA